MIDNNTTCRLYDLKSLSPESYHIYTEPIYTKMNSMYGYLSVNLFKVYFFWYDGSNICRDDVSEMFRVEYVN